MSERGTWGKGWAYPLLGDKVFVMGQPPDTIWNVAWAWSSREGRHYRLLPWPRGRTWTIAPDQSLYVMEDRIRPLDLLTQIHVAMVEAESSDLLP